MHLWHVKKSLEDSVNYTGIYTHTHPLNDFFAERSYAVSGFLHAVNASANETVPVLVRS